MGYKETREEEDLRKGIERLKAEEKVIRGRRQTMEARLRRLVWQRMMRQVEEPQGASPL